MPDRSSDAAGNDRLVLRHVAPEAVAMPGNPGDSATGSSGPGQAALVRSLDATGGAVSPLLVRQTAEGRLILLDGRGRIGHALECGHLTVPVLDLGRDAPLARRKAFAARYAKQSEVSLEFGWDAVVLHFGDGVLKKDIAALAACKPSKVTDYTNAAVAVPRHLYEKVCAETGWRPG
jgi:hypothetical protein